ncbi:hypothetical protein F4777DRAFT_43591 [Nemania sp. FL0916]|nr:hypothetical protein F4777DRAFT_43591 [Nemania sp. FL0916]
MQVACCWWWRTGGTARPMHNPATVNARCPLLRKTQPLPESRGSKVRETRIPEPTTHLEVGFLPELLLHSLTHTFC